MRILVTGCTGYVGGMALRWLGRKQEVLGVSDNCAPGAGLYRCDLRDAAAVAALARDVSADVVVHASGSKDIAFCEKNPDAALAINGVAAQNVARSFGDRARVLYVSTDYVFAGDRGNYREEDTAAPLTAYGRSKLGGETMGMAASPNFLVLRTAALYDRAASFPAFLIRKLAADEPVQCYADRYYSPTYYVDFLNVLERIVIGGEGRRIYHACGPRTTRFLFARALAQAFGFDTDLVIPSNADDRVPFLFPDLSMNCDASLAVTGLSVRHHRAALTALMQEGQE